MRKYITPELPLWLSIVALDTPTPAGASSRLSTKPPKRLPQPIFAAKSASVSYFHDMDRLVRIRLEAKRLQPDFLERPDVICCDVAPDDDCGRRRTAGSLGRCRRPLQHCGFRTLVAWQRRGYRPLDRTAAAVASSWTSAAAAATWGWTTLVAAAAPCGFSKPPRCPSLQEPQPPRGSSLQQPPRGSPLQDPQQPLPCWWASPAAAAAPSRQPLSLAQPAWPPDGRNTSRRRDRNAARHADVALRSSRCCSWWN
jgi:hypothetical protein